ncbi:MAG TPA: hypothetical protein VKD28_03220 [Gemmatimonadales bacterium]|nr:hypothetical protein [Gemmatimonadales bacterium]
MRIYGFDPNVGQPVTSFQSRATQVAELGGGTGESHAFLLRFESGGVIGPHVAEFGQLFAPMEGTGWIEGGDGMRHAIGPGQVAFVERGEMHAKGSDAGMTALMIQIRDFTPLRLALKRVRAWLFGIALASVAACGDPLSFGDVAGSYPLGAVNARKLPYLLTTTAQCDQTISEGQLILQEDGLFTLTLSGLWDCSKSGGGGWNTTTGWQFPGNYTIDGAKLHFVSPRPPSIGGFVEFTGVVGPLQQSVGVRDLDLSLTTTVDLEFRH